MSSVDPPEPERRVQLSVAVEVVLDRHHAVEHDAGELVTVDVRVERERQRTLLEIGPACLNSPASSRLNCVLSSV